MQSTHKDKILANQSAYIMSFFFFNKAIKKHNSNSEKYYISFDFLNAIEFEI